MYYVVKTEYVGPNANDTQHIDSTTIEIRTAPALGNMDRQPVYYGWAGTTNDWAVHACGEYETLEAARDALLQEFGPVRLDEHEPAGPETIEVYRPGALVPMSAEASIDWVYCDGDWPVTAQWTDSQLLDYTEEAEDEAVVGGLRLDEIAASRWALQKLWEMQAELEHDARQALGALAAALLGEEE